MNNIQKVNKVDDIDYDKVRFRDDNGEGKIYTLIKGNNGKYTCGLGYVFFNKKYIEKRFNSDEWIEQPPKHIVELTPKKTPLELIEERLTTLEAIQVKPKVTEDWKSVACLSYNDIKRIKKLCENNVFCSSCDKDLKILENTIKQKLSL